MAEATPAVEVPGTAALPPSTAAPAVPPVAGRKWSGRVVAQAVPLLFLVLCLFGIVAAKISPVFLLTEMLIRFGRNAVLVLALIIPILAGLGLNFGIVVGAMAGQIGAILVTHWGIGGVGGWGLACLIATPLAVLFGWMVGNLFNKAKGREMVTGLIAAFFANGIYQFIFLFLVGSVIPFNNPAMIMAKQDSADVVSQGVGLRNTVDIQGIQYAVDDLVKVRMPLGVSQVRIPIMTFLVVALVCAGIIYFLRTKLGQECKAMGQDAHVAAISGISVDRNRVIATILSTVIASWGQLLFLQNMGTFNTYNSHEQVGMFAIAALLVSGATVRKATVPQALVGTILFHTLFVVSPLAGATLAGDPQVGEFFRLFVAYAVITLALVLHAWQAVRKRKG
jgi:simple sugar transport system permease protein